MKPRLKRLWRRLSIEDKSIYIFLAVASMAILICWSYNERLPYQSFASLLIGGLGYYFFKSQYKAKQAEERIKEHYRFLLEFANKRKIGWKAMQAWYLGNEKCDARQYQQSLVSWVLDIHHSEKTDQCAKPTEDMCKQFRIVSLLIQHFGMAIEQKWLRHDEGFDHFYSHWRILLVPVCKRIKEEYGITVGFESIKSYQYPLNPNFERIITYDQNIQRRSSSLLPFDPATNPIVPLSVGDNNPCGDRNASQATPIESPERNHFHRGTS